MYCFIPLLAMAVVAPIEGSVVSMVSRLNFGQLSDAELVARVKSGDGRASQLLYERHVDAVFSRAARLLGRSVEAEDIVQDAFVEAFRDLKRLREPAKFGAWLNRIVVHQVHRQFRKRSVLETCGLDVGQDDMRLASAADTGAGPEVLAALAEIDELLAKLPTRQRLVWMLRHVEGFELKEIAEQCGCSLASTKRYLNAATRKLDRRLGLAPRLALSESTAGRGGQ